MNGLGRLLAAAVGAATARYALREIRTAPPAPALERTNFRGRTVTLAAGPALAVGAAGAGAFGATSVPAGAAALVAGLGAGAVGLYDDVVGGRPEQKTAKGFTGHLAALREGRVTAGTIKVLGVGAAGLGAAVLLAADPRVAARRAGQRPLARAVDVLLGAGVVAGTPTCSTCSTCDPAGPSSPACCSAPR